MSSLSLCRVLKAVLAFFRVYSQWPFMSINNKVSLPGKGQTVFSAVNVRGLAKHRKCTIHPGALCVLCHTQHSVCARMGPVTLVLVSKHELKICFLCMKNILGRAETLVLLL